MPRTRRLKSLFQRRPSRSKLRRSRSLTFESLENRIVLSAILNPDTGHYYELVPTNGRTPWAEARDAAAQMTFTDPQGNVLQGYLATITSQVEDDFLYANYGDTQNVWIGGSDATVEGEWRWVTGPEGQLDGGQGQLFWVGGPDGTAFGYAGWIDREPNARRDDADYIDWNHADPGGDVGWNDLYPVTSPGGNDRIRGYIVEFGDTVANGSPLITSSPNTIGTPGFLYEYDIDAIDPDSGDTITYSLDSSPAGMTIDAASGVIQWIPTTGQVGFQSVSVRAQDPGGLSDLQSYSIDVAEVTISINDAVVTEGDDRVVFLDDFVPGGRAGLSQPTAIEYGPQDADGDGMPDQLFAVNYYGQNILRFDAQTGSQGEVFVPAGSGGLLQPISAVFGPDGNLYTGPGQAGTSVEEYAVLRYDGVTGDPLPASGQAGAGFAIARAGGAGDPGIAFDAAGDMYVSNASTDEVLKYQGPFGTNPGELISVFADFSSGFIADGPNTLVFGPDGHLYVTSWGTDTVLRFDGTTGAPLPAAGESGADFVSSGSGGLDAPYGLLFADHDSDGDQDLFIGGYDSGNVLRFDGATGDLIEIYVLNGSGGLVKPVGLQFTPEGNLLVGNYQGGIIRYGRASQAVFTVTLSKPIGAPFSVQVSTADGTAKTTGLPGEQDYEPITQTLVFGPEDTSISVLVPVNDDGVAEPTESFFVNLTNLSVPLTGDLSGEGTILDAAPPTPAGITVTPISGLVTGEDGTTDSFTVVLDAAPTSDVTIDVSTSDDTEGLVSTTTQGPAALVSLTFTPTNWDTPQTVTVTGVDDAADDDDVAYAIVTAAAASTDPAYSGLDASDVSVTNVDNEVPAGVVVTGITPNALAPKSSTTVTISGSGFAAGASVSFTGGSGPSPNASSIVVAPNGLSLTATVSTHKKAHETSWDVVVTNPDGSNDTLVNGFTVTTSASATSSAYEVNAATLDTSSSIESAVSNATLVAVASPLPSTETASTSSTESESTTTSVGEGSTVDEAISDFDASPLDEALLEDLAVSLVG